MDTRLDNFENCHNKVAFGGRPILPTNSCTCPKSARLGKRCARKVIPIMILSGIEPNCISLRFLIPRKYRTLLRFNVDAFILY